MTEHTSNLIEGKLPCPLCDSSDAYHVYDDGHGYCFSCKGQTGSKTSKTYTYEFMPHWGVNENVMRFYGVKTKIDDTGKPTAVGFVYPNGAVQVRLLDEKKFFTEGEIGQAGLFGRDKFAAGCHKNVVITEGAKDALSYRQVLHQVPVVSVQSSSSSARDCIVDRNWLNAFDRIYLAFDTDAPGKEATAAVAKLFDYNKVAVIRLRRKDVNEHLAAGEEDELRYAYYNAKAYLPEDIISSNSEFEKILREPPPKGVPYPFPTLNEMTWGIRPSESVLITAQEGIGKTELMHEIEYQLLKETDDAIAAIFLEETKRRHLQALAGRWLNQPVWLPSWSGEVDDVVSGLGKILGRDDRLHLYSHFGSSDPEHILDTIRFLVSARGCRYVLFDHISMAVSGLAGSDETKALDYISTRLEMMVKELNFGLIVVSHVNDEGQTRGSRMIGKVFETRIDATRNILSPDPIERATMRLMISKNRPMGKTGSAGELLFDQTTGRYSEVESASSWTADNDNSFKEAA